jgi:predicted TPR repeat methyltransferase
MNRAQRRKLSSVGNPTELVQLADSYQNAGRLDAAEQEYRKAITLHPSLACAHNNLGSLLQKAGRIAEATEHFSRAFKTSPRDVDVLFNLAKALCTQGQFQEANALYRDVISLKPLSAGGYYGFALTLAELGDRQGATLNYSKALEVDPGHLSARVSLGLMLVDEGKIAEALEHAQVLARAEAAAPPDFPHLTFGVLLARTGCPDGAKLCFETHLAAKPGDKEEVAMLLAAMGGPLPERLSEPLIAFLYNGLRASKWDQEATRAQYQGHRLVVAAIDELNPQRVDTLIDAGCGTGLVGGLLRAKTTHLVGIDISEVMLDQARQKNIYDDLSRADLVEYLDCHPRGCDIISCAATLIHFGNLNPVFGAAAQCLRPGGLFVFTVFPNDDDPDAVCMGKLDGYAQGGCFMHGHGYIMQTAVKHGFRIEILRRDFHESSRTASVMSLIVALRLVEAIGVAN